MKIRNGFVSNSSSSSFTIVAEDAVVKRVMNKSQFNLFDNWDIVKVGSNKVFVFNTEIEYHNDTYYDILNLLKKFQDTENVYVYEECR